MSRGRRTKPKSGHLHQSIAIYLAMQAAGTEDEFQRLLAAHDRCTDADGLPRVEARTLEAFRRGPGLRHVARVPPSRPPT